MFLGLTKRLTGNFAKPSSVRPIKLISSIKATTSRSIDVPRHKLVSELKLNSDNARKIPSHLPFRASTKAHSPVYVESKGTSLKLPTKPLRLQRPVSTLQLQELICDEESETFSDEIRVRVWGHEYYTKDFGDVDGDNRISLNNNIKFDNRAHVLITELDGTSDDDLVGLQEIPEVPTTAGALSFYGSGGRYRLRYKVIPIPPPDVPDTTTVVVTPSPNKAVLKIKSLICIDTTEDTGDDLMLTLSTTNNVSFPLVQQMSLDRNQVKHFGTSRPQDNPASWGIDYPFDTATTITLNEGDLAQFPFYGVDDFLGTNTVTSYGAPSYNNKKSFRENNTEYHLIYDVIPKPLERGDNSFIHVHPLYFMPHNKIKLRFATFIPMKYPITWKIGSADEKTQQEETISPADWQVIQLVETNPDASVYIYTTTVKYVPSKLLIINIKYNDNIFTQAASFSGLPASLSSKREEAFQVVLGSCFERTFDNGRVSDAFRKLFPVLNETPHAVFLVGDQVYLDHPATELIFSSFSPEELASRFYQRYLETYSAMRAVFSRGAHYFISDDHDFFNGYPFIPTFLNGFSSDRILVWAKMAKYLFKALQTSSEIETFNIGDQLSFFIADTRMNRDKEMREFLKPADFEKLLDWIKNLQSPGILVLNQPVLVEPGSVEDTSLASYKVQYKKLVEVIGDSVHDIVVLSGDVHFSRFAEVKLPKHKAWLYEVISSPLSLLESTAKVGDRAAPVTTTTVNGVDVTDELGVLQSKDSVEYMGAARWKLNDSGRPGLFPPDFVRGEDMASRSVISYPKAGRPPAESSYRTEENFSHIRFFKVPGSSARGIKNGVRMEVDTYMVRRPTNLPADPPKLDWSIKRNLY